MLGRILIIGLVVIVGLWLIRKAISNRGRDAEPGGDSRRGHQAKLIACAHCHARLPATDAVWKDGQAYCSMTHRHLGPKG